MTDEKTKQGLGEDLLKALQGGPRQAGVRRDLPRLLDAALATKQPEPKETDDERD